MLDKLDTPQTAYFVCLDYSIGVFPISVRYVAGVLDQLTDFFKWSETFALKIQLYQVQPQAHKRLLKN